MEDHSPQNASAEHASARAASALHELEQRAHAALSANRDKVSQLEADISLQLDAITATLQAQVADEANGAAHADSARAENELLIHELAESRAGWESERVTLIAERDELAARIDTLESQKQSDDQQLAKSLADWQTERTALESCQGELEARITSLEALQQAADEELARSRAERELERGVLETQRDELAAKLASIHSNQSASHQALVESQSQLESERAALITERDELATQVAALESQQRGAEQAFTEARATWEAERAALSARYDQLAVQVTAIESQQQPAQLELTESRSAWDAERAALTAERDELAAQIASIDSQQHVAQDEWRNQLLDFEARLREQQASWNEQRTEWSDTCSKLERERDELQQKFELALQDLQRFRGRIAELEQELARRPETNQADSTELVALRAERDELSRRVEELEHRPEAPIDPNAEQQFADLQRRFEMAVEDVRELKTKNAKLESQLAASATRTAAPVTSGGMDWESQKRRLLASLEGEAEPHADPVREKERATIQGTIDMTDAVVAEKDHEIAQLKAELANAGTNAAPSDADRDRRINELVDADEVVAEHRKRIGQLEREMEEKLRAAELELSIERAKMARQKADLEELKSDLESQRQAFASNGGVADGAPRRKWLSKLGLNGEEQK